MHRRVVQLAVQQWLWLQSRKPKGHLPRPGLAICSWRAQPFCCSTRRISWHGPAKHCRRRRSCSLYHRAGKHGELKQYTIGAVFEKQPLNSSFGFEAITLWDNYWDTTPEQIVQDDSWEVSSTLFLRINDPQRTEAVTKQLQRYIEPQNLAREDFQLSEYYLQNFETLSANFFGDTWLAGEQLRWGFPPSAVLVPGVMAGFLLLLACFNFTNTSMAVSGRRLREIGIRKTMGGRRAQLIAQFLGESIVLCTAAVILGMILAEFLAPLYNSMWDGERRLEGRLEKSFSKHAI
jgi:hypothetical protein